MIRVAASQLYRADIRTRIPFKYGIATMIDVPHVFVRLIVNTPAGEQAGVAADHLPPKWFTKDPTRAIPDEIADMLEVITHALTAARAIAAPDTFRFWQELRETQAAWAIEKRHPPLLAQFGTSLVERALLDAIARQRRTTLARLVHSDQLGIRLGEIHPELDDARPGDLLPGKPLERVQCRHTIGLGDPLTDAGTAAQSPPDDDLPLSLAANIRHYGLRHFKLKINGRVPDAALDRLEAIGAVLFETTTGELALTIDGNESFASAEAFRDFWSRAAGRERLRRLFRHLLFVEQPLCRAVALDPQSADFRTWPDRPAIIIDESDAELADVPRALELGYAGTSHKNCKGVFKGIANACLIAQRNAQQPDAPLVVSGEDLCNIGPVALLQDLAVQALLGVRSVERNGHHYFAGLSIWPAEIQRAVLRHHSDLYVASSRGWPRLRVEDGEVSTKSVVAAPLGLEPELPLASLGFACSTS